MSKIFTLLDIDRLRREAKRLARSTEVPLHEAQAQIANREGFRGWERLVRASKKFSLPVAHAHTDELKPSEDGNIGHALTAHVTATCVKFINRLSEADIFRACWSGSIWIRLRDVQEGTVNVDSFEVLGPYEDRFWKDIGLSQGMVCLLNFDGLAESFVLEDDEDYDGEPTEPAQWQEMYSPKVGRAKLIEIARDSTAGDIAKIELALQIRFAENVT